MVKFKLTEGTSSQAGGHYEIMTKRRRVQVRRVDFGFNSLLV